jgi:hypothetical protein
MLPQFCEAQDKGISPLPCQLVASKEEKPEARKPEEGEITWGT